MAVKYANPNEGTGACGVRRVCRATLGRQRHRLKITDSVLKFKEARRLKVRTAPRTNLNADNNGVLATSPVDQIGLFVQHFKQVFNACVLSSIFATAKADRGWWSIDMRQ